MKIWRVDAFADKPYTGNPAAVMIVDSFPSDETCLKIAAEMNLSETVFFLKGYAVTVMAGNRLIGVNS